MVQFSRLNIECTSHGMWTDFKREAPMISVLKTSQRKLATSSLVITIYILNYGIT